MHDAELAKIHHHEPLLRHSLDRLPRLSSEELFAAQNETQWKAIMMKTRATNDAHSSARNLQFRDAVGSHRTPGDFELYAMLESIAALSFESRYSSISWDQTLEKCQVSLISWYESFHVGIMHRKACKASLMMLWHSTFMLIHGDLDALELSCGKSGPRAAQNSAGYARMWVQSDDAKRCLLHAVLVQRHFESIPIGTEPSIQVPICLYYCGIVLFCFLRFGGEVESLMARKSTLDFPELRLLDIDANNMIREEMGGFQLGRLGLSRVYRVIDLLQGVSHWRVAHSLASTLLALVEEEHNIV